MRKAILILLLASPAVAYQNSDDEASRAFRIAGWFAYGAKFSDLASTEYVLRHPGIREGNPLMQNQGMRVATSIAGPIMLNWGTEQLRQKGHGRLAFWLRIFAGSVWTYVTVNNMRLLR